MGALSSLAVYCGSGMGQNPDYAAATRDLGRTLAERGIDLVYGGGRLGLMGIIADTVLFIFAILGVNLLKGMSYYCDTSSLSLSDY